MVFGSLQRWWQNLPDHGGIVNQHEMEKRLRLSLSKTYSGQPKFSWYVGMNVALKTPIGFSFPSWASERVCAIEILGGGPFFVGMFTDSNINNWQWRSISSQEFHLIGRVYEMYINFDHEKMGRIRNRNNSKPANLKISDSAGWVLESAFLESLQLSRVTIFHSFYYTFLDFCIKTHPEKYSVKSATELLEEKPLYG